MNLSRKLWHRSMAQSIKMLVVLDMGKFTMDLLWGKKEFQT